MPLSDILSTDDRNDDTQETQEDNHTIIAQVSGPTNQAHGWGTATTPDNVNKTLQWQGHPTVLHRHPNNLIFMCVNAGGGLNPRSKNRKTDHTSRLLSSQRLVQDGIIDIMIITEADLDDTGVRNVREVIKEYSNNKVGCYAAPTSLQTTLMEYSLSEDPIPRCTKGGVLLLIRQDLARHITHVAHYRSGRILHIEITIDKQTIHILSIYGVSAPTSSKAKIKLAKDVHDQLQSLLHQLQGQAVIVAGDLNTTPRPQDRSTQVQNPADKNEYALWRLLQTHGLIDVHAQAHPQRRDFTYFAQQRGSRLDAFWASAHLLNKHYRSAISKVKGPLSADHHCIALNLTLPTFAIDASDTTSGKTLPVYAYNAQSRPRRATIQPNKAQSFTQHLTSNTDLNTAAETLLGTNPEAWTVTAQALTLLQLPLNNSISEQNIHQAPTQAHSRINTNSSPNANTATDTTAINEAAKTIRTAINNNLQYNLQQHRTQVHAAVTNWTHSVSDACRAAQTAKNETNQPPTKKGAKKQLPTTHLLHLINRVSSTHTKDWPSLEPLRQQIHTVHHPSTDNKPLHQTPHSTRARTPHIPGNLLPVNMEKRHTHRSRPHSHHAQQTRAQPLATPPSPANRPTKRSGLHRHLRTFSDDTGTQRRTKISQKRENGPTHHNRRTHITTGRPDGDTPHHS